VASLQEKCTDIVVFKGNLSLPVNSESDDSDLDSEAEYLAQEKRTHEYYQRNNKENCPTPRSVQKLQLCPVNTRNDGG